MPAADRLRAGGRIVAILGALLVCYPLHLIHRALRRTPSPWVGRFLGLVGRIVGLRVAIAGRPAAAPVLFVANHLSWLDILGVGGATGSAFVAKAEIGRWPVVGWLARVGSTVFVEREARAQVLDQKAGLAAALGRGRPVTLFAEGTTGQGDALLPFRASLLAAVAGGDVAVQPLAIDYGADLAAVLWPENEPAGKNALALLGRRGCIGLTLRFAAPIDARLLDRKVLAARAQSAVAAMLAG